MQQRYQLTLGVLISLQLQLLCSLSAFAASAAPKIVLGYAAPGARALPFWMAEEQGLFSKYGIDVQPVFIRGAPIFLVAGLASGGHSGRQHRRQRHPGRGGRRTGFKNHCDVFQPQHLRPRHPAQHQAAGGPATVSALALPASAARRRSPCFVGLEHGGLDACRYQMHLPVTSQRQLLAVQPFGSGFGQCGNFR